MNQSSPTPQKLRSQAPPAKPAPRRGREGWGSRGARGAGSFGGTRVPAQAGGYRPGGGTSLQQKAWLTHPTKSSRRVAGSLRGVIPHESGCARRDSRWVSGWDPCAGLEMLCPPENPPSRYLRGCNCTQSLGARAELRVSA